ncbi:Uncharacterised protein [Mycobacteroides abscessus subsp. abscessus]|nr:Uncharacterised protein [Mycobacteroides abscessus subsp. abscessus]
MLLENLEMRPRFQAADTVDAPDSLGQGMEVVGRVGGDRRDHVVPSEGPREEFDSGQGLDLRYRVVVP